MPTAFGFRPYTNRNILRSGYPICASATFNPAGDFKPVAFGVVIDGMRYRYIIKAVKSFKENSRGEFIFDCEYIDFGRVMTIRLVFDIAGCRWMIG